MDKPTVKRVYTPPKIMRVELNPEQAVLSPCSINTTSIRTNVLVFCDSAIIGDRFNCRKSDDGGAKDFSAVS